MFTLECEIIGREKSFPGFRIFSPISRRDTTWRTIQSGIFLGMLKIALLLCSVTKPLTPAPCARCVSGKERGEEAPAQRKAEDGRGWGELRVCLLNFRGLLPWLRARVLLRLHLAVRGSSACLQVFRRLSEGFNSC